MALSVNPSFWEASPGRLGFKSHTVKEIPKLTLVYCECTLCIESICTHLDGGDSEVRYLTRVNEYQFLGMLMDRIPNVAVSSTSSREVCQKALRSRLCSYGKKP